MPPSSRPPLEELNRRLGWALPAIATLVFGIVRLPELTRSSLWYDELFSVGVAGLPVADALRRIVADHTNPPLFYMLLKAWMALGGDGDLWVRLLPCLFAMLLGAALVWLAREVRAGALAGTLAVALAAASPLLVDLANEVRAYSLLTLLSCLSLAAVLHDRRLHTRDSFTILTLINVALVHTHYFGWFTVAAECAVAVAWWQRAEAWRVVRSAAFALLAFLPWATAVASHALTSTAPLRNVAWITPPGAAAPLWLLRDFTGRSGNGVADLIWLAIVLGAFVVLGVSRARGDRSGLTASAAPRADALALLAAAGVAVPLVVWLASMSGIHSLWVQRYLSGVAAPLVLLTAIAVASLPPKRTQAAAIVALAWSVVAFSALPQRAPTKFDWRHFTRRLEQSVGAPRDIYALEAFTAAPLQRYAGAGTRVHVLASLDGLPAGDAWLVYRSQSFADGSPATPLRARGYTIAASLSSEAGGQRIVAMRVRR